MSHSVKPVAPSGCRLVVLALLLSTVPGCAMFGNAGSLSNLIADSGVVSIDSDSEPAAYGLFSQPEFDESVVDDISDQPVKTTDRSQPAARLLAPDFEETPYHGGHTATTVSESNPWMSDDAVEDTSLIESFSRTAASAGSNPLFRRDENVKPVAGSSDEVADATGGYSAPAQGGTVPVPPKPTQERSVLDRIRGFADSGSDRKDSRGLFRRQLNRIPKPSFSNPFDFFDGDDKDDSPPPLPPAPAGNTPNPSPGSVTEETPYGTAAEPLVADTSDAPALLIQALTQELRSWPRSNDGTPLQPTLHRRREVDLRLARLIADQDAAATEAIESMSPHEQEFWQELILGISQFRRPDESVAYNDQLSMTVGQLRSAIRQLEPISSLAMRRLDFCDRIHGFGSIESRSSTIFDPGDRMMIYAEVENLATELTDFATYRTVFSGTLQLCAASGTEALREYAIEPNESESTSRRVDYYLSASVTLPSLLPPGEYEMRLTLKDDLNNRQTSGVLKFSVQ